MKVEFYLYNQHEIAPWAPIWRALTQRGVAAQFVIEPPGVNTAHGSRPDAAHGYHDTKTEHLVALMTDEMYAQVLGHLARAGYAYAKAADHHADAVLTTQGHYWIRHYQGLKLRTGYGVSPHRDAWGYGATVNADLDAILTHGALPAALTRRHAPPERVLIGGYPKFDAYLRGEVDRAEWQAQFGLDPRRPTVVYFSTWAHNSSLEVFAQTIAGLAADYNVLYKPHHNNLFFEAERLAVLRQAGGVVVGQELSSVPYYAVADLVLADVRSGSLTEAILTGRRVIGLSPAATPADDQLIPELAAVVEVCREAQALPALVAASLEQAGPPAAQRALAPQLFSDFQGHAAAVTADIIIEQVERAQRRPAMPSVGPAAPAAPHFSVIIPTYQRPATLKKCLDALARQTVPPESFEVLVSDDGSPDHTPDVVRAYQAPYKLTYLRQANSGPAAARNRAIEQARGEYLLILNDDALLEPDALAIHAADQAQGGGREAVLGLFRFLPEHLASPFGYLMQNSFLLFAYGTIHGNQVYQLTPGQRLNYMWFYTCNLSVRRQLVLEVGGFDEWFSGPAFEDLDLGLRLEQAGVPLRYDPRALAWHDHAQSPERYVRVNTMRKRWMLAFCLKHPTSAWYRSLTPAIVQQWRAELAAAAPKARQAQALLEQLDTSVPPGAPEDELKRVAMEMYPIACWLTDYTDRRGMLESPHLEAFLQANAGASPAAVPAATPPAPSRAALRRDRKARRAQGADTALALTVVVPTYNRREALARCLTALDTQTLPVKRFEVIVVDDGSTDDTSAWLAEQHYGYTLRCFQQPNAGPGAARNRGAAEARGEVVLFIGDDIYAPPKLLAGHLDFHRDFPSQFEAVVGRVEWADTAPVTPFMRYSVGPSGVQFGFDAIRDPEQAGYRYFYTCNLSLKRSLLAAQQPLFDTAYWYPAWEDIDLGFRLQTRGLRLRYRRKLLAHHDHPADLARYRQRQFRAGQMACLFARQHPHTPEARQTEAIRAQYRQSTFQTQALADTTTDERLLTAAAHIEAAFAGTQPDAANLVALEQAYAQVLQRAYARGILAGETREAAPPAAAPAPVVAASQPPTRAEAILNRLLEAPEAGAVLREVMDQLDAEFLGLVRLRARAARLADHGEMADGLTELATGVAGLLAARAEAPAADRAAELYERLLNGADDLGEALERHAGELSDDFLALVRSNAVGARQEGNLDLAEGLEGFADAVVSYLAP